MNTPLMKRGPKEIGNVIVLIPSGDHERAHLPPQSQRSHAPTSQATASSFTESDNEVEIHSVDPYAQEPHRLASEDSDSEYLPDEDESDGEDATTKRNLYRKASTNIPRPVLNLCSIPQGPVPLPRFFFRAYGQHSRAHLQAEGAPFANSTVYGPRIDDMRLFPTVRNHVEYWKATPSPLISTTPFLIWALQIAFQKGHRYIVVGDSVQASRTRQIYPGLFFRKELLKVMRHYSASWECENANQLLPEHCRLIWQEISEEARIKIIDIAELYDFASSKEDAHDILQLNVFEQYSKVSLGMVRKNLRRRSLDYNFGKGIGALAAFLGLHSEYYRPQFVWMVLQGWAVSCKSSSWQNDEIFQSGISEGIESFMREDSSITDNEGLGGNDQRGAIELSDGVSSSSSMTLDTPEWIESPHKAAGRKIYVFGKEALGPSQDSV